MIKYAFGIILCFTIQNCLAQNVTYNYLVDTSNIEDKQIQTLFENYIHSKPDSIYDNPYWADSEKDSNGYFDILSGQFQPSLNMGFPIQVLSIKSKEDTFQIKAMFSYCNEGTPYVLAIANYYAFKENGEFKLHNALFINRKRWNKTKIGWVTFYYPHYEYFDSTKANELNDFVIYVRTYKLNPPHLNIILWMISMNCYV